LVKDEKDDYLKIHTVFCICGRVTCVSSIECPGVNAVRQAEIHMAERIAFEAEIAVENVHIY
jgi:hypothetical protein